MPNRIFLALYRVLLQLQPQRVRARHAAEQIALVRHILAEERPSNWWRIPYWQTSLLVRLATVTFAAHLDEWQTQYRPTALLLGVGSDVRLGLRSLRRSPWYAGSSIVVLVAGVALSSTVFAVVDGVLFRPLPYEEADALFLVDAQTTAEPSRTPAPVSALEVSAWTAALPELELTVINTAQGAFKRRDGVDQLMHSVDEHFFDVIGIRPLLGDFLPEDFTWKERLDSDRIEMFWPVIISHAIWTRDFGRDPGVIGRQVVVSERQGGRYGHIIRGVLPADFVFPLDLGARQPDVLSPEGVRPGRRAPDSRLHAFIRLTDPSTAPAIGLRLHAALRSAAVSPSNEEAGGHAIASARKNIDRVVLVPISDHLGSSSRSALRLIAGGTGLLLLVICLNIATLTAARYVERLSDFATRRALGASPWRLARLVAIETAAIVAIGTGGGLLLAESLLRLTTSLLPSSLVLLRAPAIDPRVIGAAGIGALLCIAVIAFPAAADAARGTQRTRATRARNLFLIGAQSAVGFLLVTSGVLTMTSLGLALKNEPGYQADQVVLIEGFLSNYRDSADSRSRLEHAKVMLSHVQGVAGIAATNIPMFRRPLSRSRWTAVGRQPVAGTTDHEVDRDFFEVMSMPAIAGRLPAPGEWAPDAPYVVVSETAARLLWPGEAAVGRDIAFTRDPAAPKRTVIGVVRDARFESLDKEPQGSIYFPVDMNGATGFFFVIRTTPSTSDVIPQLVAAARDSGLRVDRTVSLDTALFAATAHRVLPAWLFGSLGFVALAVLAIGTLGLLAMAAAQRSRELVIRVALGASSADVMALLVRDQISAVALGLSVGAAASYWVMGLLGSQLYQVSPFSPGVWLTSGAVLLGVTFIATLVPAVRSSRINPAEVLRAE